MDPLIYYACALKKGDDPEEMWEKMEQAGLNPLYGENINGKEILYVATLPPSEYFAEIEEKSFSGIDWQEQWETNWAQLSSDEKKGFVVKDGLIYLNSGVCLAPGAGFGDLSHPTTRLSVALLEQNRNLIEGSAFLDIGCGSGVLAFVAKALGAKEVQGIDCDLLAVEHAKENCSHNPLLNITFSEKISSSFKPKIAIMNMIQTEQEEAFKSICSIHDHLEWLFTSGVRKEDIINYEKWLSSFGAKIVSSLEEKGWLAVKVQIK